MPASGNYVLDGNVSEINDFGGQDTYTISPTLTGNVIVRDNDISTINLPAGMNVTAVQFMSNGVQFEVNGHTVRFLGRPDLFVFVLGGNPLDLTAGIEKTFEQVALSFGASIPAPGSPAVPAAIVGVIQDDGTVGPGGPPPDPVTITNADLINFTTSNPFDAGKDSYRFELTATDPLVTTITNFGDDDSFVFINASESNFQVTNPTYFDEQADITVKQAEVELVGLVGDFFWDVPTFREVFGADSLLFS